MQHGSMCLALPVRLQAAIVRNPSPGNEAAAVWSCRAPDHLQGVAGGGGEGGRHGPEVLRHERLDVGLPLRQHPQGDGLHPPCARMQQAHGPCLRLTCVTSSRNAIVPEPGPATATASLWHRGTAGEPCTRAHQLPALHVQPTAERRGSNNLSPRSIEQGEALEATDACGFGGSDSRQMWPGADIPHSVKTRSLSGRKLVQQPRLGEGCKPSGAALPTASQLASRGCSCQMRGASR